MSRIDDLIAEHCPNGVERRPLGQVGTFHRGKRFVRADMVEQGVPCIHYGEIYTRFGTWAEQAHSFISPDKARDLRFASPGDLVIVATGETVEDVCKAVAWLGQTDVVIHDACFAFRHKLDPKFLSYVFQTEDFKRQVRPAVARSKVVSILTPGLSRIEIPVPPMVVQQEIADTLGRMELLKAELEAELDARKRQYAFYRDSLLDYSEVAEVSRVRFGDVATIVRGASPRPIQAFLTDREDGVSWIKIGDVPAEGKFITGTAERITPDGASKSRRVVPGDFVLSNSMSFGRPYIAQIEGCIHDGWLAIKDFDATYVPDFLYHLLRSTPVYQDMASRAGASTVKNLNADIVKGLRLPAPPLEEQRRIATLLDKFDLLVNDLEDGLPGEIRARRTQYEYYRDRLLTFEEQVA